MRNIDGKSQQSIIPVEIKNAQTVEREVELIRNTNIIRLTVEGLQYLHPKISSGEDLLETWVIGTNTCYLYNNALEQNIQDVYYSAQYTQKEPAVCKADIKVQRLGWNLQDRKPMILYIKILTGHKILLSIQLVELLKQAKDEDGNYIYRNQEDPDRIYVHPLKLSFQADMSLKIYVHNREIKNVKPEI